MNTNGFETVTQPVITSSGIESIIQKKRTKLYIFWICLMIILNIIFYYIYTNSIRNYQLQTKSFTGEIISYVIDENRYKYGEYLVFNVKTEYDITELCLDSGSINFVFNDQDSTLIQKFLEKKYYGKAIITVGADSTITRTKGYILRPYHVVSIIFSDAK